MGIITTLTATIMFVVRRHPIDKCCNNAATKLCTVAPPTIVLGEASDKVVGTSLGVYPTNHLFGSRFL